MSNIIQWKIRRYILPQIQVHHLKYEVKQLPCSAQLTDFPLEEVAVILILEVWFYGITAAVFRHVFWSLDVFYNCYFWYTWNCFIFHCVIWRRDNTYRWSAYSSEIVFVGVVSEINDIDFIIAMLLINTSWPQIFSISRCKWSGCANACKNVNWP